MTDTQQLFTLLIGTVIAVGLIFTTLWIGIINMRDISKMSDHSMKLGRMEHIVQQILTNIQINQLESSYNQLMQNMSPQQGQVMYKTADGKYSASSLKELFEKMANDPSSDISKTDMDALKRFFEQVLYLLL